MPEYNILQALKLVRSHSLAAFDETVDVCVILNVDPKHGDQVVRGTCSMPYGLGKTTKIAVFTSPEFREKAKEAGADIIGDEAVFLDIKAGNIQFEKCIATSDAINDLKPYAKILGPKGLMPNQKIGNLVPPEKLIEAIKQMKQGSVTYRVDVGSNIHSPLGKVSFEQDKILGNLKSLMGSLVEKKPISVKGQYFLSAYVSSTMGPSWRLALDSIDPRNKNCLL